MGTHIRTESLDLLLRVAAFNPYIPLGTVHLFRDPITGFHVWARHPADITPIRMGTCWHVTGNCPTWTEEAECLCMVEGV